MDPDSNRLQQLIHAARVQGLGDDPSLQAHCRRIIAAADSGKRHLTTQELQLICAATGRSAQVAEQLQRRAHDLVDKARAILLNEQPGLVQEGGALHPAERAEACWRDCWQFHRVIIYAYACGRSCFTDPKGMAALRELYRLMNVPVVGLNIALRQLEILTLSDVSNADDQALITAAFSHLRGELNKTAVKS